MFPLILIDLSPNLVSPHQNDSEWEAELEGELNEYEMVGEDGEAVGSEDNPEWENQIEEMLEAETKKP